MVLNVKNAIVSKKLNITGKQYGAVRQILILIHLDLKQKKENLVLTYLSISIAKRNIRQIAIAVLSGNIDSTEWYVKKPQELREIRANSTYSNISRNNNYKTP